MIEEKKRKDWRENGAGVLSDLFRQVILREYNMNWNHARRAGFCRPFRSKQGHAMLGLGDGWVAAAFIANIVAVLVCIVYGAVNWNRSDEEEEEKEDGQS